MTVLDSSIPRFHLAVPVDRLAEPLRADSTACVIKPCLRFNGQTGEQWTMVLLDPAGNTMEFNAFVDDSQVFTTEGIH